MIIIGRNVITDTIKNVPSSIEEIFILRDITNRKIDEIVSLAKYKNIPVKKLDKMRFKEIFDDSNKSEGISQGIAAKIRSFQFTGIEEMISKCKDKQKSVFILLDEIQDPHNLGAIIRTASSAGTDGIIITEKNSAKINHTVFKTSAGAINFIDIHMADSIYEAINKLKSEGYKIIGTDLKTDKDLYHYKFPYKCCIAFGNEGEGLRTNIKKLCSDLIKIPINTNVDSLNVSVSAGVILYEIYRQHKSLN